VKTCAVSIQVNGRRVQGEVEARTLLAHFLRDGLHLTGTHIGCDTSQCGACTVHLNGQSIKSCSIFAIQCHEQEVLTIEGVAQRGRLHPMQQAFTDNHALQCGYCTPGMILQALDIIRRIPDPTEHEVRAELEGNICRCTGYHNIVKAILAGAKATREAAVAAAGGP
jgi:carbon-monoxide dehydrogenase small subunit